MQLTVSSQTVPGGLFGSSEAAEAHIRDAFEAPASRFKYDKSALVADLRTTTPIFREQFFVTALKATDARRKLGLDALGIAILRDVDAGRIWQAKTDRA